MNVNNRIDKLFFENKLKIKEVSDKIKVPQSTISQYKNSDRAVPVDFIEKLANAFPEVSLEWLVAGRGAMFHNSNGGIQRADGRVQMIEILSATACAGPGIENYDISVVDMIPVPSKIIEPYSAERVKAMQVQGDSMTPTIYSGDYVLYVPGEVRDNGIYVIDVFGELRCKRIEFRLNGDITVMSDNTRYSSEVFSRENDTLRICGKVVGWIHKHNY